ncbi:hypothetical protein [Neptunicella sp.]|uniref:hypothetical protein n=1 Tax=Neptunicella sp. TaxID=2125986 RepID=UPI003F690098
MQELATEWRCLQQQYEDYEKMALWIKLLNVLITLVLLIFPHALAIWLVAVLYVQDAVVKTMQSRLGNRLLVVEQAINTSLEPVVNNTERHAYQLHSQWRANRTGVVGLLAEYMRHCLKPTVAFPHVILLALLFLQAL